MWQNMNYQIWYIFPGPDWRNVASRNTIYKQFYDVIFTMGIPMPRETVLV